MLRDGMVKEQMLVEINRQPEVVKDVVENFDEYYSDVIEKLKTREFKKIYLAASGSSYHASVVIAYFMQSILKVDTQAIAANLFAYHQQIFEDSKNVLVIVITQSGTSGSAVNAINKAKKIGATSLVVSQHPESISAQKADLFMEIKGKETHCPETGGYISKILMFYLLANKLAYYQNKMDKNELIKRLDEAKDFANNFPVFLKEANTWFTNNKEEILKATNITAVGYGINYGTAIEAKLKISEATRLFAGGFEVEEYIHGHVFSTNKDTFIFTIASKGEELERFPILYKFFKENVTEHIFTITAENIPVTNKDLKYSLNYCDELMTIAYVLPFQIMSYHISVAVGRDTTNLGFEKTWPARVK